MIGNDLDFVFRAMSIARLNFERILYLHRREKEIGWTLSPGEIARKFSLGSFKQFWGIPEGPGAKETSAREAHLKRLAADLKKAGCTKDIGGYLDVHGGPRDTDWPVHAFDLKVCKALEANEVDFSFKPAPGKKSLVDEVSEDSNDGPPQLALA